MLSCDHAGGYDYDNTDYNANYDNIDNGNNDDDYDGEWNKMMTRLLMIMIINILVMIITYIMIPTASATKRFCRWENTIAIILIGIIIIFIFILYIISQIIITN